MSLTTDLLDLARGIDPARAEELLRAEPRSEAGAVAVLVGTAFPPLAPVHAWQHEALERMVRRGFRSRRSRPFLLARLLRRTEGREGEDFRSRLRREVWRQRARIALRELLPRSLGGAPIDMTARELSYLAESAFHAALAEAMRDATRKIGPALRADGQPSALTVLGMGKLGGEELNAGSDVDLILLYDTDEGAAGPATLHEYWTHVARRAVSSIETPTEDGFVSRVDLRLRPEGSQGPLVYSWVAAERYYETWGRLWERAAMLRARPVAGDLDLGEGFLREVIAPFVYRKRVDPSIATALAELVDQSRTELRADPVRDLKLGRGGIREAEFFVQSLQLIWGGMEPSLRVTGTLPALDRLESKGLVTSREAEDIRDAYALLRRAEHAVQWRTGVQTHALPRADEEFHKLARILRFRNAADFRLALERARSTVMDRFSSLLPESPRPVALFTVLLSDLEQRSEALPETVEKLFGDADVEEHLLALARRPDGLLGGLTRERHPDLPEHVLSAIRSSPDAEQAARCLRSFFARFLSADAYLAVLSDEPRAISRFVTVLGASAFVGDAIVARPDLADIVLFGQATPTLSSAEAAVDQEVAAFEASRRAEWDPQEERDEFIGALRRAQRRVTVEVAVADLAGELLNREVTRVLSALADRILLHALRFETGGTPDGLAVIAVGKLGGGDIGYGSDLDVLFIYDPAAAPDGEHPPHHFSRLAQRIIRTVCEPHSVGPGYDLDTRLRPSGSQGLLVTSLSSFARYHGVPLEGPADDLPTVLSSGAAWERQALLRARVCAGDPELGTRAIQIAHAAAYGRGAPPPAEVHRLRMRMEKELARERPGRFDLKTGRGGLLDVEFAVQWLQMRHGGDVKVRTTDTVAALHALNDQGYLSRTAFESLRDGYVFLRRLEQRIRIVHGTGSTVLDAEAEGLPKLARRMGFARTDEEVEGDSLLQAYADVTDHVRRTYEELLGVKG